MTNYASSSSSSSGRQVLARPSSSFPQPKSINYQRSCLSRPMRFLSVTSGESRRTSSWTELGVPPAVAKKLEDEYPYIHEPTPAQQLFLAAVGSGKEVFLKDDMGRGKTLALAIAALTLAVHSLTQVQSQSRSGRSGKGARILIIVPTPHLAYQIFDHLSRLTPKDQPSSLFTMLNPLPPSPLDAQSTRNQNIGYDYRPQIRLALPDTPIVLSTAKNLQEYQLHLPSLSHIFSDEPDTMLGTSSTKRLPSNLDKYHKLNRHPPPIINILNKLLSIKSTNKDKFDFSTRRDEVNTIWVSATMNSQFWRFVKTRGWVRRGKEAVFLDFTQDARQKDEQLREKLLGTLPKITEEGNEANVESTQNTKANELETSEPKHFAVVVDPESGDITSLELGASSSSKTGGKRDANGKQKAQPASTHEQSSISPVLLESLAILHASSPPPAGRYSLVLPPEGVSLDQLGEELSKLGVATFILTPEVLQLGIPSISRDVGDHEQDQPILLARRSSVPGLHLDNLHTIYLISGLDVEGLSPKQRKSGGVKDRWGFYDLVSGRLGRLGSNSAEKSAQRVISLVVAGSEGEKRLSEMFLATSEERTGKELTLWDMAGMQRRIEESVQSIEARDDSTL